MKEPEPSLADGNHGHLLFPSEAQFSWAYMTFSCIGDCQEVPFNCQNRASIIAVEHHNMHRGTWPKS